MGKWLMCVLSNTVRDVFFNDDTNEGFSGPFDAHGGVGKQGCDPKAFWHRYCHILGLVLWLSLALLRYRWTADGDMRHDGDSYRSREPLRLTLASVA